MGRTPKMVIIFLPSFETGGVERNAVLLASYLVSRSIPVQVACLRIDPLMRDRLAPEVEIVRVGPDKFLPFSHSRIMDGLATVWGLVQLLRRSPKGQTVVVSFQSSIVSTVVGFFCGTPVVARIANHPALVDHEPGLQRRLSEILKPVFYRLARMVITNSTSLSEHFRDCLRGVRVETVFNPIDRSLVADKAKDACDHPWLVQKEQPVLVAVGRLSRQKAFDDLIRAFAAVRKQRAVRLIILGEGDERRALEALIKELDLTDCVTLQGFEPNVHRFVARADVFVLSSRYEGLPNALLEAIAAGTPVIATDCLTGPREILLEGAGGELVPVGDIGRLAGAIEHYLSDADYARSLWSTASKGLDRFEQSAIMGRYEMLLCEALTPGAGGS